MCVLLCLLSASSRRVGALEISVIIIFPVQAAGSHGWRLTMMPSLKRGRKAAGLNIMVKVADFIQWC